ncbi:hypothetical protein [Streptomyces sp. B6B3]|uniref:hypothetical protein n=1 Tax=Streptomyces sp. B6B3 TaxID=3153570 RepID=UPI00325D9A6A
MGDERNANPDQLDHLANLLEHENGATGASIDLGEMFTRATNLNASGEMTSLQPLQTWLFDTSWDLRGRAAGLRGEDLTTLYSFPTDLQGAVMPTIHGSKQFWDMYRNGNRVGIPAGMSATYMADYAFTGVRPTNFMGRMATAGMTPRVAGWLGGSHSAASYGGFMRNGSWFIPTAQQSNLLRVAGGSYTSSIASGSSRLSSFGTAMSNMSKASGLLRGAGVAGSAFGTVTGVVDLVNQGNPVEAFQNDPSGYTVDVTGTAFNASMTAALVCPNPVTVGLAVGTGIAYGAALVWDNWDTITDPQTYVNAANAVVDAGEAVVDTVADVGGDIVDGIGDAIGSLF